MRSDAVLRNLRLLLDILQEAPTHGTHKYALVLGILDSLPEIRDCGDELVCVDVAGIADRIIEMYWEQTLPFVTASGKLIDLAQLNASAKGPHVYVSVVAALQAISPGATFDAIRIQHGDAYAKYRRRVIESLIKNPIPRFHVGFETNQPLWTLKGSGEGSYLTMPKESEHAFVSFSSTIREVAQQRFIDKIVMLNRLEDNRSSLEAHLFGADRLMPSDQMRDELIAIQGGSCVYTGQSLERPSIDHFLPWSMVHLSEVENLLVTNVSVNSSKGDRLADPRVRDRWQTHVRENRDRLRSVAAEFVWSSNAGRVHRAVDQMYAAAGVRTYWAPSGLTQ